MPHLKCCSSRLHGQEHNIYNVVIWFGETFISLGECVINCKCYLIQRILSPGKVKVRSVLKLWSIFTLLSDLENAVIWSSQIDHSFGRRFFHYGFSFNSNSVVSVSYLVYVCYGPWLYRPWGRRWTRGRWKRRMRSRSKELEEVVGDNEAIFRLERIWQFQFIWKRI